MRIGAGDLDKRVAIRRSTDVDDGHGGQVTTWATIATVWAEVKSLNGREALIGKALQGVSSFRIRIRWRGDVRTSDQLIFAGKTLNIRAADDPDERREQLVILADDEVVLT